MEEFMISERYRMEIHWKRVRYEKKGTAIIEGCYLNGPVLKDVAQLNEKDFIKLDFANQYIIFVKDYYVARLSWKGVRHTTEKIFLQNVELKNENINILPKLHDNDYIVVDTINHENEKHQCYMTYPAYLLNNDGILYNFSGLGVNNA